MRARTVCLVVTVLIIAGCGQTGGLGESGSSGDVATSGDPAADFIAAYRAAHQARDVDAVLDLYCLDDVPADLRETIRGNLEDQFLQSLADVRIDPIADGQIGETESGGVRWRPNLEASGMCVATFSPPPGPQDGFAITSIETAVGLKDGKYRFVVMVPAN